MPVHIVRGPSDPVLDEFAREFRRYEADYPPADIDIYRHGRYSVRVRVVSPSFEGLSRPDRHDRVWAYLETLSEETLNDLSLLILLTPAEVSRSFSSMEFDDPLPAVI